MISPSVKTRLPQESVLSSSLIFSSLHPATQQVPIPLATTAACEVMPPWLVTIAWLTTIPSISSGDVSCLTKITFLPKLWNSLARSAVKTISPVAAPGLAGKPCAMRVAFSNAASSKTGCIS